jgi:opacity protein-like surface antigen
MKTAPIFFNNYSLGDKNMMMRKVILVVTMLIIASVCAYAQDDEYPVFELSGTYSILVADIDFLDNETLHGWGIGGQVNLSKWFGIAGEYTANHGASGPVTIFAAEGGTVYNIPELDTKVNYLLFGPRFSYRHKYVTVFGHWLAGAGHNKLNDEKGAAGFQDVSNWTWAMAIGGGLDINMGKHFALRAAQFDWAPISAPNWDLQGSADRLNNVRYQMGGVIKF